MNYIIKYTVIACDGKILQDNQKMRAKNKLSKLDAQIKFEAFLKKKYTNFGSLIVHDCSEEKLDFGNMFGDIFGSDNPFKF